jgi:GTPase SAR1 family protein
MINEIKIKAPVPSKTDDDKISNILFQMPFRVLVIAPSNSGKTVLISNLISNKDLPYRKIFKKNIFIWSSTFSLGDPSFSMSDNIEQTNIFDEYDESSVMEIVNEQMTHIKKLGKKKCPDILFIFDDIINDLPTKRQTVMSKLFFSARHYKISILLLSQQYKMCPRPVRLNASDIMIFQTGNNSEIKIIAEEQAIDSNVFIRIYKDATSEPFSFLTIHNKLPISERYQKRLSNYIYKIDD